MRRLVVLVARLSLALILVLSLALTQAPTGAAQVPAAGRPSASGACAARDLYRDEVVYRLRQVQRRLVDHAPDGFAYDPDPAARAVDEVFAVGEETCGDEWWSPVAAAVVNRLFRAGALDPAGERGAWLQASYDALALALGFEALDHDRERAMVAAFGVLDVPRERPRVVALWSRLAFHANIEHPRTADLPALARRAGTGPPPPGEAGGPLVLAHQGGSRRFPPNTLAAFGEARALGADGVECDLRLSRDGEVFVLHDDRLADPADPSGQGTMSVRESPAAHAASPDSARLILSVQHFAARAPEALRRARELGLRTSSFTPNRFDDLERALTAGIDFIQTDRPDRALWLRARQAEKLAEVPADATPGAPR